MRRNSSKWAKSEAAIYSIALEPVGFTALVGSSVGLFYARDVRAQIDMNVPLTA